MTDERGITWDWSGAARGALSALPGGAIVLADVTLGVVVALGSLVVAMLGVPPVRKHRARLGLVGLGFAAAYALGSVLGLWSVAAIAGLVVLAYLGAEVSVRKPAARLLPALLLPALALEMNHPAPGGLVAAGVMLAGCAWATVATYAWPESQPPAVNATAADAAPEQPDARYVAPAGSALIVLLLSGASSRSAFDISFSERLVETAIGAALALTFGIAVPRLVHAVGDRDGLEP